MPSGCMLQSNLCRECVCVYVCVCVCSVHVKLRQKIHMGSKYDSEREREREREERRKEFIQTMQCLAYLHVFDVSGVYKEVGYEETFCTEKEGHG